MSKSVSAPSTAAGGLFHLASLFTFLTVAMGTVVCATNSGNACPTWPGCDPGRLVPQWELNPIIEFTHRLVAGTAGLLLVAAAVVAIRLRGAGPRVRVLPWLAIVGAVMSAAFGRRVVLGELPTWLVAVDLFCGLAALTLIAVAAVRVGGGGAVPPSQASFRRGVTVSRLALTTLAVLVAMHIGGLFTAGKGSFTRCIGWPLGWELPGDVHPMVQDLRVGLAGLGAVLVLTTAGLAVRSRWLRGWGVVLVALLVSEAVVGVLIRVSGLHQGLAGLYAVLAVALLWCLGLLVAASTTRPVTSRAPRDPRIPAAVHA